MSPESSSRRRSRAARHALARSKVVRVHPPSCRQTRGLRRPLETKDQPENDNKVQGKVGLNVRFASVYSHKLINCRLTVFCDFVLKISNTDF